MPLAVNWNSKNAKKIWKKAIHKAEICRKTSPKTSKFQLKQAQKQATRRSSKKPTTPQKTSPNSRENRKVGLGNTESELANSALSRHFKKSPKLQKLASQEWGKI